MSALRPPTVVGVGGGVGTTTVATALRAHDGGTVSVRGASAGTASADSADILVCRGSLDSLHRAGEVLERLGPGPRPVLAVTLDGARLPRGPLRAHLELLEVEASAVVLLPRVPQWRSVADPLTEIATLLVDPPQHAPRQVRAYTAALRELAAAVAASGRLGAVPSNTGDAHEAQTAGTRAPSPPGRPPAPHPTNGSSVAGSPPARRSALGTAVPGAPHAVHPAGIPHVSGSAPDAAPTVVDLPPARVARPSPRAEAPEHTGLPAVAIRRGERPAPPILATARPVVAPPRTAPSGETTHGASPAAEAPRARRRGVRIVTAAPVERVG